MLAELGGIGSHLRTFAFLFGNLQVCLGVVGPGGGRGPPREANPKHFWSQDDESVEVAVNIDDNVGAKQIDINDGNTPTMRKTQSHGRCERRTNTHRKTHAGIMQN